MQYQERHYKEIQHHYKACENQGGLNRRGEVELSIVNQGYEQEDNRGGDCMDGESILLRGGACFDEVGNRNRRCEVVAIPMPIVAAQSAQPTTAQPKVIMIFLVFIVFSS